MPTLLFSHLCQRNFGTPSLTPPTFHPPGRDTFEVASTLIPYSIRQARLKRCYPERLLHVFTVGLFKVHLHSSAILDGGNTDEDTQRPDSSQPKPLTDHILQAKHRAKNHKVKMHKNDSYCPQEKVTG